MTLDDIYMRPLDYIDGTRIRRVLQLVDPPTPPRPPAKPNAERKRTYRARHKDRINASERARRAKKRKAA